MKTVPVVLRWLEKFALAVRSRDYAAGQELFADNVFSFGTFSTQLDDLDTLVKNQWKPTWSVTRDFHFHTDAMRCEIVEDIAWVAVPWQSQGQGPEGKWYDRQGRATLILRWYGEGCKAVHSHFSLQPEPSVYLVEPVTGVAE
ncbi:MAG: nuclear transport factor 2 family protein, partial [Armatimonadota bacterium]